MHFRYQPVEGETATNCQHTQIRDLPDWKVICSTAYGTKTYTAHVIVRQYNNATKTGLELLYWVTEPGETPTSVHKFHSTSALMKFKGSTELLDFSLSQGVENDMATLDLSWTK